MKKYEYTYTIKKVSIEDGDILVEYMPANINLLKYVYNVGAYGRNEAGDLKTIEQTILDNAPHGMWETQEMLLSNLDGIINKTGTVTPND